LRDRLRRWWAPAQWADDHPLDASKRVRESTQTRHERPDPQSAFGAEFGWGARFDPTRDFRKR
jgi:hypothetical protein